MKTIFSLLIFLSAFSLFADFGGKVVGVSDGDTITVLTAEKREVKVRLFGVDCPEKSQDFGSKAKGFTSAMVFGRQVEVKEKDTDRYGRVVGVVLCEGKNLNLELVKAGLAWHYKQYSKSKELAKAEQEARDGKAGLWSQQNPQPPWEFRHKKSTTFTPETVTVYGGLPAFVIGLLLYALVRVRKARARRGKGPRMNLGKILKTVDRSGP